ncbi:MAG: porphyrinogen peroxidase [Streptomyces sp.]|nr:porphyrinogen peroxidase [Streptomyces sp.]
MVPDGDRSAGGTVLLVQRWEHDYADWTALPNAEQERIIGRTKPDSIELDDRPATSHAARTIGTSTGRSSAATPPTALSTITAYSCHQRSPGW